MGREIRCLKMSDTNLHTISTKIWEHIAVTKNRTTLAITIPENYLINKISIFRFAKSQNAIILTFLSLDITSLITKCVKYIYTILLTNFN